MAFVTFVTLKKENYFSVGSIVSENCLRIWRHFVQQNISGTIENTYTTSVINNIHNTKNYLLSTAPPEASYLQIWLSTISIFSFLILNTYIAILIRDLITSNRMNLSYNGRSIHGQGRLLRIIVKRNGPVHHKIKVSTTNI